MSQIPRHILIFLAIKDGNTIDLLFQINSPADMPIPLPGDEVDLPDEVATKAGFINSVFKVVSRRFLYRGLSAGIAGAVSLTLSQEP